MTLPQTQAYSKQFSSAMPCLQGDNLENAVSCFLFSPLPPVQLTDLACSTANWWILLMQSTQPLEEGCSMQLCLPASMRHIICSYKAFLVTPHFVAALKQAPLVWSQAAALLVALHLLQLLLAHVQLLRGVCEFGTALVQGL